MTGTRKNSKASMPKIRSKTSKKKQNQSTRSIAKGPGPRLSSAQAFFLSSFKNIFLKAEEGIPEWNIRDLSEEEFTTVCKELMRFLAMRINTKGEISYVAKKVALFLIEMLHGALRRGIKMSEVLPVHAILIDEMYSSVDSARTGIFDEEADVKILLEEAQKETGAVLHNARRKAGKGLILP